MDEYTAQNKITDEQHVFIEKLKKSIENCAAISLYKENHNHDITYIGSSTCTNRFCFICNWHRKKMVRRKFINYFTDNEHLYLLFNKKTKKEKVVTKYQWEHKYQFDEKFIHTAKVRYGLMHLTLTVPHTAEHGFCGTQYYYEELIQKFNFLRKKKEWLSWVYGGEFGVETEMKKSGLHIHIHALLMVRLGDASRNKLRRWLTITWNSMTVNPYFWRTEILKYQYPAFKKGNPLLTDEDIAALDPKGATMITLDNIFVWDENHIEKLRQETWNKPQMIKAVLETIKYHFEPHVWDKKEGGFNIPLMVDTMPHVHNKRLFNRFGCLLGEKPLSLTYQDPTQELEEVEELLVDEETGELINEFEYMILHPMFVQHFEDQQYKPVITPTVKRRAKKLDVSGTHQAVDVMSQLVQIKHGQQPRAKAANPNAKKTTSIKKKNK